MCFVSSREVFGQPISALPLLFATHAFSSTRPGQDFLSLFLLRRSRKTLFLESWLTFSPSLIDLPTEVIHMIGTALVESAAQDARRNWEDVFLRDHVESEHEQLSRQCTKVKATIASPTQPAPLTPTIAEAIPSATSPPLPAATTTTVAATLKDQVLDASGSSRPKWWNDCYWCDKMRGDALWELSVSGGSDLLHQLQRYLGARGLELASTRPLEHITCHHSSSSSSSLEGTFVVCLPSCTSLDNPSIARSTRTWIDSKFEFCDESNEALLVSSYHSTLNEEYHDEEVEVVGEEDFVHSMTSEQILATDLSSCSVDEDEGAIGYIEDAPELSLTRPIDARDFVRFSRLLRDCQCDDVKQTSSSAVGADLSGPRWLRVVEVDCECS